jgi:hypothetical protein
MGALVSKERWRHRLLLTKLVSDANLAMPRSTDGSTGEKLCEHVRARMGQ